MILTVWVPAIIPEHDYPARYPGIISRSSPCVEKILARWKLEPSQPLTATSICWRGRISSTTCELFGPFL